MHRCDRFSQKTNKPHTERRESLDMQLCLFCWTRTLCRFRVWNLNRVVQLFIWKTKNLFFFLWRQHGSSWAGWSEISFCSCLLSCVSKLLISFLQLWAQTLTPVKKAPWVFETDFKFSSIAKYQLNWWLLSLWVIQTNWRSTGRAVT